MGIKEELADWIGDLKKTGEIKDEEVETLTTILGKEKVLPVLRKSVLATSEFSKKMDALQKEHQDKMSLEDKFHEDVANWRKGAEAKLQRTIRERESLEAQIRELAESNNADPEKDWNLKLSPASRGGAGDDDPLITSRRSARQNNNGDEDDEGNRFDPKRFKAEFEGELRNTAKLNALIADIQGEHQSLFGKPVQGMSNLVERAFKEKKSLKSLWEEENKVTDRRAEIEKTKQADHDKQVADAAVSKYVSENAVDPSMSPTRTRPEGSGSPMLDKFYSGKKGKDLPPEERSISSAMEAFRSGKYRDQAKRGL